MGLFPTMLKTPDLILGIGLNGIVARVSANTYTSRVITAGTNVTVVDGDGVSGNPTISVPTFPSEDVIVDRISGSTYSTLQDFVNTMHSPGLISGGELSVISSTQVRVAAGTGMIRVADDNVSSMPFFDWAQTDFTIPADDVIRHFGVVYNAGAPIVEMRTAESWDKDTEFALGAALHISSNGILSLSNPFKTGDPITNIIQRFDAAAPVLRDSYFGGLIISNTGTRNIAITAGTLWHRLNDNAFAAFDSSGASRFTTVYYSGSAWVFTPSIAQWPNAQYNDVSSGLVAITGNRYVNLWFYIGASGANVFMVYGQAQHVQLADALDEGEPAFFPPGTRPFVVLVGKLTFQNGGATPTQLASPFTAASLGFGSVNTHNDLSGLQGGTTAEYYHLTSAAYNNISSGITASPTFASSIFGPTSTVIATSNLSFPTYQAAAAFSTGRGYYTQRDNGNVGFFGVRYGGSGEGSVAFDASVCSGTFGSPGATQSGDGTTFRLNGYDTTNGWTTSPAASVAILATEAWTATAHGARIRFVATANGSTVAGVVGEITSTGLNSMAVGATTPSTGAFTGISSGTVGNDGVLTLKRSSDGAGVSTYQYIHSGQETRLFSAVGPLTFYASNSLIGTFLNTGLEVVGSVKTAAPSGSTAMPWKLGDASAVSPTAPNRTVAIDVNGTVLYLHAKTTND